MEEKSKTALFINYLGILSYQGILLFECMYVCQLLFKLPFEIKKLLK